MPPPASTDDKEPQQAGAAAPKARNPDRFYCPYPGCNRSFAELWRLKVHYRAPPDVRGSGKERGHGTELELCPKCGKDLKPGKHHVGCSAGRSAPRQAAKRVKPDNGSDPARAMSQQQHGGPGGGGGIAVGQPVLGFPVNRPDFFGFPGAANGVGATAVFNMGPGRPGDSRSMAITGLPSLQHHHHPALNMVVPPASSGTNGAMMLRQPSVQGQCRFGNGIQTDASSNDVLLVPTSQPTLTAAGPLPAVTEPFAGVCSAPAPGQVIGWTQPAPAPGIAVSSGPDPMHAYMAHGSTGGWTMGAPMFTNMTAAPLTSAASASTVVAVGTAVTTGATAPIGPGAVPAATTAASPADHHRANSKKVDDHLTGSTQRPPSPPPLVPSPPPLPADWDMGARATGLLFDFDMFNTNRPQYPPQHQPHHHTHLHLQHEHIQTGAAEPARPFVTVTTAVNPSDMACPSDDYIMQILFGDVNEPVPRRMTTHLHHFEEDTSGSPAQPPPNPVLGAGGGQLSASLDSINALLAEPAGASTAGPGAAARGHEQLHHHQLQQQHPDAHQPVGEVQGVPLQLSGQQLHLAGVAQKQTALAASVAAGLPVEQGPVNFVKHEQQTLTVPH